MCDAGISGRCKAYRLWCLEQEGPGIIVSNGVTFNEMEMPFKKNQITEADRQ